MVRVISESDREMVGAFYAAMDAAGVRYLRLQPYEKTVEKGTTWEQNILQGPSDVIETFAAGWNVGLLLVGKDGAHPNPLGLCILDKDSDRALEHCDLSPFRLSVSRGHHEKAHFYGRMDDLNASRRSRHVRGSHDVKLTGIVVGPGSRHRDGGIYRILTRPDSRTPWTPWDPGGLNLGDLPAIRPSDYAAMASHPILRATRPPKPLPDQWNAVAEPDEWSSLNYLTDLRPLRDRWHRGSRYIENRIRDGIISRSGAGGRATLLVILTHLRQYLRLPTSVCLSLLLVQGAGGKSWNDHCVDAGTRSPYPWSVAELESALQATEHFVPYYGVLEYANREAGRHLDRCLDDFVHRLAGATQGRGFHQTVSLQEISEVFHRAYGLPRTKQSVDRVSKSLCRHVEDGLLRLVRKKIGNHMTYRGLWINDIIEEIGKQKLLIPQPGTLC